MLDGPWRVAASRPARPNRDSLRRDTRHALSHRLVRGIGRMMPGAWRPAHAEPWGSSARRQLAGASWPGRDPGGDSQLITARAQGRVCVGLTLVAPSAGSWRGAQRRLRRPPGLVVVLAGIPRATARARTSACWLDLSPPRFTRAAAPSAGCRPERLTLPTRIGGTGSRLQPAALSHDNLGRGLARSGRRSGRPRSLSDVPSSVWLERGPARRVAFRRTLGSVRGPARKPL